MIKRDIFTQTTPATSWEVAFMEQDAHMGRALAAYDVNGNSLTWDSWEFKDGKLMVNFGIDPVAGTLSYEYQSSVQQCDSCGPLVSIAANYGSMTLSRECNNH